jgi:hypothetical protein
VTDIYDLIILLSQWGAVQICRMGAAPASADFNGDSVVDVFDLLILLGNWG